MARYGENLRKIHLLLHIAKHGEGAVGIEADEDTAKEAAKIAQWFLRLLKIAQLLNYSRLLNYIIFRILRVL